MKKYYSLFLMGWLLYVVAATVAMAQVLPVKIQGQVLDAESNQAIVKANVFLSGTSVGVVTDAKGRFVLNDSLPKGQYTLVFSHVSYDNEAKQITVDQAISQEVNVLLIPKKGKLLKEITIVAKTDKRWKGQLARFKREFLGTSKIARKCKILNPWVLDFKEKDQTLQATAADEIIIENPVLGYKIYCLLKGFSNKKLYTTYQGYYRFEQLSPPNKRQARKREKNRIKAFQGSFKHFMSALLYKRLDVEGFAIYYTRDSPEQKVNPKLQPINPRQLYNQDAQSFNFIVPHYLRVIYMKEQEENAFLKWQFGKYAYNIRTGFQSSMVHVNGGSLKVSDLGITMDDPAKLKSYGYWAWERVGDMLPTDFFPKSLLNTIRASQFQTVKKLKAFSQHHPQEKIYLHQDKSYYVAGDTLWFSGYVVDASTHRPSAVSKTVFVDLIDDKGEIKHQLVLHNQGGKVNGEFLLNQEIDPGQYRLRAYTQFMADFSRPYLFNRMFEVGLSSKKSVKAKLSYQHALQVQNKVINYHLRLFEGFEETLVNRKLAIEIKVAGKTYATEKIKVDAKGHIQGVIKFPSDHKVPYVELIASNTKNGFKESFKIPVQVRKKQLFFFPEGGDLIAGLVNQVAFKALDKNGLGSEVKGYISNRKGQKVATIQSSHLGMGKFSFIPNKKGLYTAVITHKDGSRQSFVLPTVKAHGYVLQVDNSNAEKVSFEVLTNFRQKQKNSVIGHRRGQAAYAFEGEVSRSEPVIFDIPKTSLPGGMLHFTLFNVLSTPQCERLVFIKKRNPLDIKIQMPATTVAPQEKVQLSLQVKNQHGENAVANLSIAVVNADLIETNEQHSHIVSELLLKSDLKGFIEQPNFYFKDNQPTTNQALDLLMMTQGWRRFTWKQVLKPGQQLPDTISTGGLSISGVLKATSGWPLKEGTVTLISPQAKMFKTTAIDKKGRFTFNNLVLAKGTKILLQGFNRKGKPNVKITLDKPPMPLEVEFLEGYPELSADDKYDDYLRNHARQLQLLNSLGVGSGQMLKEVEVKAKKIRGRIYEKGQGQIYARPTSRLRLDSANADVAPYPNIFEYVRGRLGGIRVAKVLSEGFPRYAIFVRGSNTATLSGGIEPLYLLDGSPISANTLETIPLERIAFVDVLGMAEALIFGSPGVFAVYTKKDEIKARPKYRPGRLSFVSKSGYHKAREFYIPPYDQEAYRKRNLPDLRSTIYWNPNVEIKDGKATVSFYNAGSEAKYKIVVEGVAKDGAVGRQEYYYLVKSQE